MDMATESQGYTSIVHPSVGYDVACTFHLVYLDLSIVIY